MVLLFAITMIVGQVGIFVCNIMKGCYKNATLALLFAVANILIFLVKDKT